MTGPAALILALATSAPSVATLDGRRGADVSLVSSVALFWRADCEPCLAELAELKALRKAAAPLRVRPVVLEQRAGSVGEAVGALKKVGLRPSDSLRADGAPEAILTSYGGAPPRLPLAVAFDASGRVCGSRTGFLGYDHLRGWATRCERADATRR